MRSRDAVLILLAVVFVFLLLALWGSGRMGPGMMGGYGWGTGGSGLMDWWGIGMMVFWVALLVGLGALVVRLLQGGSAAASGPTGSVSRAEDILKERYARGELTREQYEQMRQDLRER